MWTWRLTRGGSRTAATSKMERFVIIVNGFQPLTIITKRSILDVAAVLDPPLLKLRLERNNINLSSELLIIKVNTLINFWAHLQKISSKNKKTLNKLWMTKGIIKCIGIKNRPHKKLCRLKDPFKKREHEIKSKNYKKNIT